MPDLRRGNRGTILSDFLLTITICLLFLPIIIYAIALLSGTLSFPQEIQDQIVTAQFRKILLLSYDIQSDGRTLYFTYQDRPMHASLIHKHVIIQPGTQIMYTDVDDAYFLVEDDIVMLIYLRDGKEYEAILAKAISQE